MLLIKNVKLVDALGERGPADVLIGEGKILSLDGGEAETVIDGTGLFLAPGFLDLHAHLREPGQEVKEELATGLLAAVRGGYTDLVSMPNTTPPVDTPEAVRALKKKAHALSLARLHPAAALTQGQEGKALTEAGLLKEAGASLLTDDGHTNEDAGILAAGLLQASAFGLPVAVHAEDASLRRGGVMNDGPLADLLGLPGNPKEAEAARIARDLEVLRYALRRSPTRPYLHIQHLSTKRGLELIREAKKAGLPVTAEATPHHLTLTEEALKSFDPILKVAPPLRTQEDVEALIEGLLDGTLDAIATDHAPHTQAEKEMDLLRAPFGIPSLEVAFPLLYTELHLKRGFPLKRLVELFTDGPRSILGLKPIHLEEGAEASLVLLDPKERPVEPRNFASKARFSPWAGWVLGGWPVLTLVEGQVVHQALE
ncbi:dihydroorotase [Thermus scotoductus]|uniref:Dihydroorotase n=1 Tax=Thermus scotoductus TaxID=37636 RepID=A0A430SBC9_THESC|nr:dihydroorotase [Thermus scotoductus]RTG95731.1 dihydroorotase [Thermus scotoductus]RTH09815.1 dihydroorotase [Thermus scotoductus]RTH11006.1 dihydroorotase [Thermus scotoductus]RTH13076.1 dihydroorotase [Thermus scotoductus]RTH15060.1 dihydroorotase [Thermus scotoductus]